MGTRFSPSRDYQAFVADVWRDGADKKRLTLRGLFVCSTGLAGEVGEVLEPIKKAVRKAGEAEDLLEQQAALDAALDKLDVNDLANEMGDVLYYLTRLGQRWDISLEAMMHANMTKLRERYAKQG